MYNNILVPTDGSLEAENVVDRALDLAQSGDTSIHVPHVIGPDVRSIDLRNDIELVLMGTHGRTADADRFLGSTTTRVIRRSDAPALTIG